MISSLSQIDKRKYYFDEEAAELPIRFFEEVLIHTSGSRVGEPFYLEDWQKNLLRNVYGWKVKKTGDRKHRFFYLEVPKGNGKSAIMSGLVLFMSAVDSPDASETYCVAGDKFQARIVFDECRTMIEENPRIADKFVAYKNSILHKKSRSVVHVISADAPGKHGFRPYYIAFDELHVQPNRELYDVLTKGIMKMPNSMVGMITTAGRVETFAEEIHKTALDIARGIVDNDYWYVEIYSGYNKDGEAPDDQDLFDERLIAQANPGYGTIIRPEDFDVIVKDTQSQETGINAYKQLHLNLWVGTLFAYINVEKFKKCRSLPIDLEYHKRNGTPAWVGMDMASVEDLTAIATLFDLGDGTFDLVVWCFCPQDAIRLSKKKAIADKYQVWEDQGHLITTPGGTTDKNRVKRFFRDLCETYNVQNAFVDPSFHHATLASWLEENPDLPIQAFSQTLSNYTAPTKEFKSLVLEQKLNYGENSMLEWQVDNTMVYEDGNGGVRPMKTVSAGRGKGRKNKKIDGVVATIKAVACYLDGKTEDDPYGAIDWDGLNKVMEKRR